MQAKELLGADAWATVLDTCLEGSWLEDLRSHEVTGDMTVLQLGCNRGYASVRALHLFSAVAGTAAPADLHQVLQAAGHGACGRCNECQLSSVSGPGAAGRGASALRCFCLEPGAEEYGIVAAAKEKLGAKLQGVQWDVLQLQLGSGADVLQGTRGVITLDSFMTDHGITTLQLLQLAPDANVPKVLAGAQLALGQRKVLVLSFHFNATDGVRWPNNSFFKTVVTLYRSGYLCYMEGADDIHARLSACWSPRYAQVPGAKVVCIHDSHVVRRGIDRRSIIGRMKQFKAEV